MTTLYPLRFKPVLKDYIWGGRNLANELGRDLPPEKDIAESWEIAAHPDGTSTVTNGAFAGRTLRELQEELGLKLVGSRSAWANERGKFPLLIKLLDAHRKLSVQVHPNDEYALEHEGNELGKTEMWVVLHAEPDAAVILGVQPGTTPEAFERAVEAGNLEQYLHEIPVQAGDFINVPAGSLHAILGGLLIAEIQQNSNTTYRVYDWNRMGKDGTPRPLHVDKALDVIDFEQVTPQKPRATQRHAPEGVERELLNRTDYFTVERWSVEEGVEITGRCDGDTFEIWGTLDGDAMVSANGVDVDLPAVGFTLLPAATGDFTVRVAAPSTLLHIYVE